MIRGILGVNDLGYGATSSLSLPHPPVPRAENNTDNYALRAIDL